MQEGSGVKYAASTGEMPDNEMDDLLHVIECNKSEDYFRDSQALDSNVSSLKPYINQYRGRAKLDEIALLESKTKIIPHIGFAQNDIHSKSSRSTGKEWFDLPQPEMTPELKRDLQLLKMRNVFDPKRHYRKENIKDIPKYFQTGTVIEGPSDFFSGRLSKSDRKNTIIDELVSDRERRAYFKKKFGEIQAVKTSGRKGFYNKLKEVRRKPYLRR